MSKMLNKSKVILSASRMTDMPAYYQQDIINQVQLRMSKGQSIHTLVLWTKHPRSLLREPLRSFLLSLKKQQIQLYVNLTVTGLGGAQVGKTSNGSPLILEPNAPSWNDSTKVLPEIMKLVGHPQRIRLRVDPILRLRDYRGVTFSNLEMFPKIIDLTSKQGITYYTFSFLEADIYPKVDKRFTALGCKIIPPDSAEREKTKTWINNMAVKYKVNISACCVSGFEETRCIDGYLLRSLHDNQEPTDISEPRKREKCACTHSIDIGGWPPKVCLTGCLYCYARPKLGGI